MDVQRREGRRMEGEGRGEKGRGRGKRRKGRSIMGGMRRWRKKERGDGGSGFGKGDEWGNEG